MLIQISGSPNYGSATENMFRDTIKWTSPVFLGTATQTLIAYHKINLLVMKCKNVSFGISFKNI
jgi:hypothetical protein